MKKVNNKRKYYIIEAIIVLVISLTTACGPSLPRYYAKKFVSKTSYGEWVDKIGLISHRNVNFQGWCADENKVEVCMDYDKGRGGYKELCDIINAHNKFVDDNPDYFPSDLGIYIRNNTKSEENISFFGNFKSGDSYASELGIECNSKMQFAYLNIMECTEVELEGNEDIQFDIPVVILGFDYVPNEEILAFLCEFKKADQIIFTCEDESADRDEICKCIRAHLPNVEIYESIRNENDGTYHLEKLK